MHLVDLYTLCHEKKNIQLKATKGPFMAREQTPKSIRSLSFAEVLLLY